MRSEARRGVFVIKKTKREIVGMIHAWAALESMAARLACARATDAQLRSLRETFPEFYDGKPNEHIDEYSE
ncbi:FCD domain-containing protein, partial [Stenotrophomonas maltophilia]|uniref:FCD domain-containing protein n=1 Tax=Stenotrophomonas maltophilia TaxID=40324 RepID=UPI001954201D